MGVSFDLTGHSPRCFKMAYRKIGDSGIGKRLQERTRFLSSEGLTPHFILLIG